MATLDLVNVQKSFGPIKILHDISIGLTDGEFLVLVGPSGCGKSTLMNIIAGLEEPSGGQLRLEGRDITELPPADRNISMVFQSYALYPNMTVALNNLVNSSTGVKEYNVHFAGAFIAAIPTLVVYLISGKYFVRGLMAGSVKG
ncbi:MAG TPA: ATP-binding cassette domain-containing protein [Albitalea sp.]|nr:ATP-binding cassette domain-containing protein [Albitalea sp.]